MNTFNSRHPIHHATALAVLIVVALTSACITTTIGPPSPEEIYHHTWWNYYERARTRLEAGNRSGARADLEVCLGLRPGAKYGYPKDEWRVRTYGVHFLESYFPNRELGICLFHEGAFDEAESYLLKSMKTAPSGRAKHYLNAVREKQLAQQAVPPPVIELHPHSTIAWTPERHRTVRGSVTGVGRIAALQVNGKRQFIELAESVLAFSETVPLQQGLNEIVIEAADLTGQKTVAKALCNADWEPPTLAIRSMEEENGGNLKIELICEDNMALAGVSLNGRDLKLKDDGATRSVAYRITVRQGEKATLELIDLAGNRYQQAFTTETFASVDESRLSADELAVNGTFATHLSLPTVLPLTAVSSMGDRMRPSLRLGGVGNASVVFEEEFFFDGEASDGGGLRSIVINGEPLLSQANQGAVKQYFSRRLVLDEGTNQFEVAAEDMNGNTTSKSFTVVRRKPDYLAEQYRLSVGVPPLRQLGNPAVAEEVKFSLEDELLREPARFNLLERDEGWDYILREQQLSLSDLADPRVALKIGAMLPAEMLLMASVIDEASGITVYARLVATDSGRVLLTEDVYTPPSQQLADQVSGLVMKIEQRFPLLSGRVVEKQGGKVVLDLGTEDGIVRGTRFVVIQTKPPEQRMEYGEVCKYGEALVQLDVARAGTSSGTATILPQDAAQTIREGDHVYAR